MPWGSVEWWGWGGPASARPGGPLTRMGQEATESGSNRNSPPGSPYGWSPARTPDRSCGDIPAGGARARLRGGRSLSWRGDSNNFCYHKYHSQPSLRAAPASRSPDPAALEASPRAEDPLLPRRAMNDRLSRVWGRPSPGT